jgi:hypothetical protein
MQLTLLGKCVQAQADKETSVRSESTTLFSAKGGGIHAGCIGMSAPSITISAKPTVKTTIKTV